MFELYRGGNKAWELYKQGIQKIEDIEDDFPLTHFQHLQRKGLRNQEQYINKEAIKNMISSWQFLYFLILKLFSCHSCSGRNETLSASSVSVFLAYFRRRWQTFHTKNFSPS